MIDFGFHLFIVLKPTVGHRKKQERNLGFNSKLLGIGLVVLLSFDVSQSAQADKRYPLCTKLYDGIYAHGALHKAFMTSNGGPASPHFGCGFSYRASSKAKAIAEAQRRCKMSHDALARLKGCVLIDVK